MRIQAMQQAAAMLLFGAHRADYYQRPAVLTKSYVAFELYKTRN
jgi:hypothetical protein